MKGGVIWFAMAQLGTAPLDSASNLAVEEKLFY